MNFYKAHIQGSAKLEWTDNTKVTEESPPTAWVYAMTEINGSNDFHETLISKGTSWTNYKGVLRKLAQAGDVMVVRFPILMQKNKAAPWTANL